MRFHNLIPKIFYDRLEDGLAFFVDALGFAVLYQDADMAVVARDGAKAYLVENAEWAAKDRPELGIEVDDIEAGARRAGRARAAAATPQPAHGATAAVGRAGIRDARPEHGVRGLPSMAQGLKRLGLRR
ncbi:catechol 2,3-dioxygenase-like lactoylglutathione lyase family enzyme [Pseudoxanthomonas winnipegensis]|uniref:Catechol 2,3-dioxygenase-like lactoylglutathione lyase family enzyme n=1 Tax=Pseudoxanthomonas winnipegensis TaxID=2480810 RepID=A0AAW8GIH0_9GAMM|nr:hypothetical protein [Pseudoxanthomonas winnipegensis]MDQ1120859.1 catechol 2,3-dioxygenase-like lactoylglutathione lyase family enzyme [Pseudoxanthomonas winnipegensis]